MGGLWDSGHAGPASPKPTCQSQSGRQTLLHHHQHVLLFREPLPAFVRTWDRRMTTLIGTEHLKLSHSPN